MTAQVLGLPGRNPETEAWLAGLLAALDAPDANGIHYAHWDDGGEPDVELEARRLARLKPQLVVAKSMGTLVASTAFDLHEFRPERAVLIGTPVGHLPASAVARLTALADATPTLFIQQQDDITGSFAEIDAVVSGCARGTTVSVPGSDHVYADVEQLASLIQRWRGAR